MSASARPRAPAIRVVVVDDSFVCRAVLKEMLEADRDVAVVGEATSAAEAFDVVARLRPDLVTMDVRMPGGSGLDAVTRLMREAPLPILVVTDMSTRRDDDVVFEATRRGALEVARKPATGDLAAERALRASVRLLARVKVVRHAAHDTARDKRAIVPPRPTSAIDVIGVAASAGGPMALALLLGRIPRDFPACFAVGAAPSRRLCSRFRPLSRGPDRLARDRRARGAARRAGRNPLGRRRGAPRRART